MSDKLFKALEKAPNAETANSANAYDSTNNSFLDFFYEAGNARTKDKEDIYTLVENSKVCDKENTIRLVGYMRDVRNGLGERKGFRLAMQFPSPCWGLFFYLELANQAFCYLAFFVSVPVLGIIFLSVQ